MGGKKKSGYYLPMWVGIGKRQLSGGDGNVLYLDRDLGYAGVCHCQKSVSVHVRYAYSLVGKFCIKGKKKS